MAVLHKTNSQLRRLWRLSVDIFVTLILWTYFIFGFFFFFLIFYLIAYLFSKNRELAFQRLNHLFYRGFFLLAKVIIPLHTWHIEKDLSKIKSSVIVCNHVSYLDPLIIISLFARHKTIVKTSFFYAPVFGWLMKTAGYLPSTPDEKLGYLMIKHIEQMKDYLQNGGNLIVFPEGTRSRQSTLGKFNSGAFKIAKLCHAPIAVLHITNSDKLFTPGKPLFNPRIRNKIRVVSLKRIKPDYRNNPPSVLELKKMVQHSFAEVTP